tara:strand:+ start:3916 stop:4533 length:618 start_codon:yes stop_codon:yes gene_type:complete
MIDLDDPRTAKIADVISNKTAKKILGALAEKERSESELAKEIGMALNTIGYNVKKLEEAGLIEKVKGFLWSVKGKRIHKYKISSKRIVISPKRMVSGILPAFVISALVAVGISIFVGGGRVAKNVADSSGALMEASGEIAVATEDAVAGGAAESARMFAPELPGVIDGAVQGAMAAQPVWAWFLLGAWLALLIMVLWSFWKERGI